ncbi:hypothetical protein M422DRAFT_274221 [Sphaerobolus stellatus SS14]|uniref:Uncharacterized protein n=1 Tax=Sphaerobolus stellatus (strain SS14) TaxID=990650 RepID=A0A0C9TSV1_SPHS4|nr:hypothetical protein M422DRAFT_274221 [Sphaerobolus stellatus SS14]
MCYATLKVNVVLATEFGAMTVESARFIESGERFPDMSFYQILDLGHPINSLDSNIQNMVFDTGSPLPDAVDFVNVDWDPALEVILGRIDQATKAIMKLSLRADQRWLRLGNANGVLLLLRLVEFVRRVAVHHDKPKIRSRIRDIRGFLNVLLAKEAWRRWARASWQLGMPLKKSSHPGDLFTLWEIWMASQMQPGVDAKQWSELKWRRFIGQDSILSKLSSEACLTVRGSGEQSTIVDIGEREWKKLASVAAVKEWAAEMDCDTFTRGCVIEKFQFVYALMMTTWWGGNDAKESLAARVKDAEDWIASIITSNGIRLQDHKSYLSSTRFWSRPKPKVLPPTRHEEQDVSKAAVSFKPNEIISNMAVSYKPNERSGSGDLDPGISPPKARVLDSMSSEGEMEQTIITNPSPRKKRKELDGTTQDAASVATKKLRALSAMDYVEDGFGGPSAVKANGESPSIGRGARREMDTGQDAGVIATMLSTMGDREKNIGEDSLSRSNNKLTNTFAMPSGGAEPIDGALSTPSGKPSGLAEPAADEDLSDIVVPVKKATRGRGRSKRGGSERGSTNVRRGRSHKLEETVEDTAGLG